jgi:hypothetical protein
MLWGMPHASSNSSPRLIALSDLHVAFPENRQIIGELRPESDADWLLLAGDVGELTADIEWVLRTLRERFSKCAAAWGSLRRKTLTRSGKGRMVP